MYSDRWVKLYDKLLDSAVFKNAELLRLWIWCLLRASHKEQWVTVKTGRGETEVKIMPGQFVFGRLKAAEKLKVSGSSVYKRLLKLKKLQNLDIQSNTHYSIITIINWERYQSKEKKGNTKSNRQVTTKWQPSNTYKKEKKDKETNTRARVESEILKFYVEKIKPEFKTTKRAEKNIAALLRGKNGKDRKYMPQELKSTIENYSAAIEKIGTSPQYRKDPANFFGPRQQAFIDYLPENVKADVTKNYEKEIERLRQIDEKNRKYYHYLKTGEEI